MPAQVLTAVENNFTKGLVTEFTGLNFPENAATDCDNCQFTLIGDVTRRLGINYETNYTQANVDSGGRAISTYKWNNAGGDGTTELVVSQVGNLLYFYKSSAATVAAPLSTHLLAGTVALVTYAVGGAFNPEIECEYSSGSGYLFVYHPTCEPFYVSYNPLTDAIDSAQINIQIRDFAGLYESTAVNFRPKTLTPEHTYNLLNQGWSQGSGWSATSATAVEINGGSKSFVIQTGLTISNGDYVNIFLNDPAFPRYQPGVASFSGTVTTYNSGTGGINIQVSSTDGAHNGQVYSNWTFQAANKGYLDTWFTAIGNYPSNSDVWWRYKNSSGIFAPSTTYTTVSLTVGQAPQGHFLLNAFNLQRTLASGVSGISDVTTSTRPKTGAWFQGRVFYAGTDAQQTAATNVGLYSWTENIYFSQVIQNPKQFGYCYQVNDPTSEELFDLLPTDGGVIQIQGCGSIYKLFPLQNALLVFAANGIYYITGSGGIGFTANDYTIYELSKVRAISGTSFVSVNGYPYFWNEEGIYSVEPSKQDNAPDARRNALEVTPITVGSILDFYNAIPPSSKRYARAAYNPIEYVVQWIYRSTEAGDVTDRYKFDKILNFNTYNKAFYPYTVPAGTDAIRSITYVSHPGGSTAPTPTFKYFSSNSLTHISFAEEYQDSFADWVNTNYISYFVTGYKLHGQAQRRFQMPYVYMFSRLDGGTCSYKIQSMWDYATTRNSGRWSSEQLTSINETEFGMAFRRHRLRGQGIVLQIKVTSVDGEPFDIMGWSSFETQNAGV